MRRELPTSIHLLESEHAEELLRFELAMTTPQNDGSQIVLLRNGFEFKVRQPNDLRLHGVDHDSLHFELERRS